MSSSISKGWSHPIQMGGFIPSKEWSHPIQKDVLNPFQRDGWSHLFKSIHFHSIIKDSTFVAAKLFLECLVLKLCMEFAIAIPSFRSRFFFGNFGRNFAKFLATPTS
jgi:hypothetical protein